jgi:hypothetical protein
VIGVSLRDSTAISASHARHLKQLATKTEAAAGPVCVRRSGDKSIASMKSHLDGANDMGASWGGSRAVEVIRTDEWWLL